MNLKHIDQHWRATATRSARLIVPDGCLDIVAQRGQLEVVGPMTRSVWVNVTEPCEGLRFRPAHVRQWLGVSPKELTNAVVDCRDIRALRGARSLQDILNLARHAQAPWAVARTVSILEQSPNVRLSTIAAKFRLSERHLRRLFIEEVGLAPSSFARIQRFKTIVRRFQTGDARSLSDLAHDAGYTDQSHMNREVKNLTGTTPTALQQLMSDSSKTSRLLTATL